MNTMNLNDIDTLAALKRDLARMDSIAKHIGTLSDEEMLPCFASAGALRSVPLAPISKPTALAAAAVERARIVEVIRSMGVDVI